MRNCVLSNNDKFVPASGETETLDYRAKCAELTGSAIMPRVLYKGRIIEAGILGTRSL